MKPESYRNLYAKLLPEEARSLCGPVEFTEFPLERVDALPLSARSKDFLKVGLPKDSAPFLSFGGSGSHLLQPIESVYSGASPGYVSIGHNSWGDPICISLSDGSVVRLDHEDLFKPHYLAQSVETLAAILYHFQKAVLDKQWNSFHREVQKVDPKALNPDGFWIPEAECFRNAATVAC